MDPARAKRGKPVRINGSIDSRRGKTTIDLVVAYQKALGSTDSAPERLQSGDTTRYFDRRASARRVSQHLMSRWWGRSGHWAFRSGESTTRHIAWGRPYG